MTGGKLKFERGGGEPLLPPLSALPAGPGYLALFTCCLFPSASDLKGPLYPSRLGAAKLPKPLRLLLFGATHHEIDLIGSHYQFFQRFHALSSHFGRYRHNYEALVPTLKTFGASTFFTNFCLPLTWEQLEAREGTLGTSYSPDLLDLFFAFLSFHGTLPMPYFRAVPDALEKVLLQGCYRPPRNLSGLFHIVPEPHETPVNFYTRASSSLCAFHVLRLLAWRLRTFIFAIESAVRQELLRLPLPQALDFLHFQILAILCINAPRRERGTQNIHSLDPCPPTACYLTFPDRASSGILEPPQFRCWISRRVSPNMAVISLKCNSTP